MGRKNNNAGPSEIPDATKQPSFDTRELRRSLKAFLDAPIPGVTPAQNLRACRWGVYAFYDYDGEPIYVGQTRENIGARIGRHLTNQRTDAVAMNVLDPFEVFAVEIWPLPEYQNLDKRDLAGQKHLNALEAAVFAKLLEHSTFQAVLNEKFPVPAQNVRIPESFRERIVSAEVLEKRGHPDVRIARRAATIARLAQVISERQVQPGLRRTLLTQANRLKDLAGRRYKAFEKQTQKKDQTIKKDQDIENADDDV